MTTKGRAAVTKKPEPDKARVVGEDDIIRLLSVKAKELAGIRSTATKYPTLRRILSQTAEELPTDTRLPSIRRVAECLGTSLVTTQRAMTELTKNGILYSKPRAGIFVGAKQTAESEQQKEAALRPASPQARHPFQTSFDFATDSAAPHQRRFWRELTDLFGKQYPNALPRLHFTSGDLEKEKPLDVYERYTWKRSWGDESDGVLDLAGFAGKLLPLSPTGEGLLPLYHRTYFLFFNRSLLEQHGLPLPAFKTFAGQSKYLADLAPRLTDLGFDPKPYSIQEPVTLFGGEIAKFSLLLETEGKDAAASEDLLEATKKLVSFCRLVRYSVENQDDWIGAHDEFLKGTVPFFLGYSVDYWEFSQKKLPFSLGAYPTLCCDDSLFLWTRVGAIAGQSEHPVESLNFLLFLLRPEIQQRFAATGNFGASRSENIHPETTADPAWLSQIFNKSVPFHLATRERYYTAVNVLGSEIWRSLLQDVSAAETLERALHLGRSYMLHRSRGNARAAQA
jgi:ABC-type glycerol-3-phosphate transport system substrate-binding protein